MMKPPDWRPPVLTTRRLVLRPFTGADAAPLFPHVSNPNVAKFTLWDHHKTHAETMGFVRDYAELRYREGTPEPYAITIAGEPDKPIGSCGCFWASQPNHTMELGYWIAEPFWGKGIVVEACRELIAYTFRDYDFERLQARVIKGNDASCRVLEKLGFRREGALRSSLFRRGKFEDVIYFSLLRSELGDDPAGEPGPR